MKPWIFALPLVYVGCFGQNVDTTPGETDSATSNGGDTDTDTDADTDTDTDIVSNITVEITAPDPSGFVDECEEECFGATVLQNGRPAPGALVDIEVEDIGYVVQGSVADANGQVYTCVTGLPSGTFNFAVSASNGPTYEDRGRAFSSFSIKPFGYAMGFNRSETPLTQLPWIPEFTKYKGNPVLWGNREDPEATDVPEVYDYVGTLLPTVVKHDGRYYMWFAGQQVTQGDYYIGAADSDDGLYWTPPGCLVQ